MEKVILKNGQEIIITDPMGKIRFNDGTIIIFTGKQQEQIKKDWSWMKPIPRDNAVYIYQKIGAILRETFFLKTQLDRMLAVQQNNPEAIILISDENLQALKNSSSMERHLLRSYLSCIKDKEGIYQVEKFVY